MTYSVAIHELDDLTTPVVSLTGTYERKARPILNDAGACSFVILRSNPDIADVQFGRAAVITRADPLKRFAFIIEHQSRTVLNVDGQQEEARVVSGRLLLCDLERAIVFPEYGVSNSQFGTTRYFNWANPAYDDSAWVAAVLTTNPAVPRGWPDPAIGPWIFGENAIINAAPAGNTRLRKEFTIGSDEECVLYATCDNWGLVYLDGVQIMELGRHQVTAHRDTFKMNVSLSAGTHTMAVGVFNKGSDNHGGARLALVEAADESSVILETSTSWLSLEGGTPGMTVGEVWAVLMAEAQASDRDDVLDHWSWDFDATNDSDSVAWAEERDIAIQVGDDYLTVLRQLSATHCDFSADYDDYVLHAYRPGTLGGASGVEFEAGVSISDLEAEGEG